MAKGVITSYVKCKQCGKFLDMFEYLTCSKDNPICDECVRKNHEEACGILPKRRKKNDKKL